MKVSVWAGGSRDAWSAGLETPDLQREKMPTATAAVATYFRPTEPLEFSRPLVTVGADESPFQASDEACPPAQSRLDPTGPG